MNFFLAATINESKNVKCLATVGVIWSYSTIFTEWVTPIIPEFIIKKDTKKANQIFFLAESDSDEEEEKELAKRRKQTAQRHWAMIRRDVNDRIRLRKENNKADMSWNILRHQVRAQTHAEAVRLELYVKYGVVKPSANVQPIDKPALSETAQQLITAFENLEVKNIDENRFSASKISKFTEEKTQS